jgi:hypothetical protein
MIKEALVSGCVLLAGYDYLLSSRRIAKYGKSIELNPLVKKLGTFVTTIIPTAGIATLAGVYSLPVLLFYTGMKAQMFLLQLASLRTEAKNPELFKNLMS